MFSLLNLLVSLFTLGTLCQQAVTHMLKSAYSSEKITDSNLRIRISVAISQRKNKTPTGNEAEPHLSITRPMIPSITTSSTSSDSRDADAEIEEQFVVCG